MSSNFALFATIGLIVAGSVIAGVAVASTYSTMTNITTTQSINPIPTMVASTPIPTMVASTPIPTIGLSLHLMLNATVMLPNESINITLRDFNTLTTYNSLVHSENWSLPSILDWWPCKEISMYYAIFQGYYIRSNITGAVPLPMFPPGYELSCPDWNFSSIQFRPASDFATVKGGIFDGGSEGPWGWSVAVSEYYTNTRVLLANGWSDTMLHFKQGAYTVVAGDEWGDLAISYFEVI